jgi:hypothetical protein
MSDVKVEVAEFTDKTGKVTEYHYVSRADYDALVAELAGLRREHQRVWDEKKALESQLRAIDIACQSVSAENEALKAELSAQNSALAQCRGLLRQQVEDVTPMRERVKALEAALRECISRLDETDADGPHAPEFARAALRATAGPIQRCCSCFGVAICNKGGLAHDQYCGNDRRAAGLAQERAGEASQSDTGGVKSNWCSICGIEYDKECFCKPCPKCGEKQCMCEHEPTAQDFL